MRTVVRDHSMAHIRYEIVRDPQRLATLIVAWNRLWRITAGGPFQSHAWITAWWDECGTAARLRIGCAWRGDDLIAILPLCVRRSHGIRLLEWAAQPFSDYCDALMYIVSNATLSHLWEMLTQDNDFDIVHLKHVSSSALSRPWLQGHLPEARREPCFQVVNRWPDGGSWYAALNTKTRTNHERNKRLLATAGTLGMRHIAPDEPAVPVIRRLLELKRQWPDNRDSPLVRNDTTLLAFSMALAHLSRLWIFVLESNDRIIAGSINALHGDHMLVLFPAYDPAYRRAGPGSVLLTEATIWAFNHGITEIDYLLGAEPYKFKTATQQTDTHIFVAARTWRGQAALAAYHWRHRQSVSIPARLGSAYAAQRPDRKFLGKKNDGGMQIGDQSRRP